MSSIADIFAAVRLKLDGTGFEAEATAAGEKAGDSVGASMTKAIATYLKEAAPAAIGTGIGIALGAAASGAVELDTAIRQLRASTGLTGEAAVDAGKSLAAMAKTNLATFDEIGAVMAKVHNDLGLTGAAADKATQQFLTFAEATGQDAAEAVVAFDDILDGWNLTADDAALLMDKLIASTQTYGGTVPELESSLAALAPTLQGLNVSVDDAIGLLNLFNSAGVETAGMSRALATAVKNLKPGESLDTLLAQLAAVPDQAARTRKAIELFGSVAGPKLALAIQPGRDSLDDFVLSEAAVIGKTKEAADVITDSFANQAKMAFKEFQVSLAEVGLNMDSVLVAAALFGPKLFTVIGGAIGGLAGQGVKILAPRLADALASLWLTAGGSNVIMGAATQAGVKGATAYALGISTFGAALVAAALADAMAKAGNAIAGTSGLDAEGIALAAWNKAAGKQSGEAAATGFVDGYTSVLAAAAPKVEPAGKAMGASVLDGYRAGAAPVAAEARATVEEVRQAIIDGKAGIVSAWRTALTERNAAANAADQIIINNAEIAAAKRILADKKATKVEKAEARIRLRNLEASNLELLVAQSQYGTRAEQIAKTKALLTSKALLKGLKDKDPEVRQHWKDVKTELQRQLGNLDDKGYVYGLGFTRGFIRGLVADVDGVRDAARVLSKAARPGGAPQPRAGGGPVVAGRPYIVGEVRPEVFVPSTSGTILPSVPTGGPMIGSLTVNVSAGGDTSLGTARRFGQAVLDVVADGLREQTARYGRVMP